MIAKRALISIGMAAAMTIGASTVASAHGVREICADQPCGWHFGPMTGQGHMGQGHMHMMDPGMMGQGMGPGMMSQQGQMLMMGQGMMGQLGQMPMMGRGLGMMGQGQMGPGMMQPLRRDLSADDVQHMLGHRLAWQGNPNVKVGTVSEKDDDTIVAEIVTQDGSLVQRLEVDRHTGSMRPVQ